MSSLNSSRIATTTIITSVSTSLNSSSSTSTTCALPSYWVYVCADIALFLVGFVPSLAYYLVLFVLRKLGRFWRLAGSEPPKALCSLPGQNGTRQGSAGPVPITLVGSVTEFRKKGSGLGARVRRTWDAVLRARDWLVNASELLESGANIGGRVFNFVIFASSIASWVLYIVRYQIAITNGNGDSGVLVVCGQGMDFWLDFSLDFVFLAAFIVRFLASRGKLVFFFTPQSITDYLTIPQSFVAVFLGADWTGIRFARAIRLYNIPEILLYMNIVRGFVAIRVVKIVCTLMALLFTSAGLVSVLELLGDFWVPKESRVYQVWTYFDATYYLLVTITTIGYGDYTPKTVLGKTFIAMFIIVAVAYFASVIPELSSLLNGRRFNLTTKYEPHMGERHIILCGSLNYRNIRSFIRHFFGLRREESARGVSFVVLLEGEPDLKLSAFLLQNRARMTVLSHNHCHGKHLKRARIETGLAVIVLADLYSADPNEQDSNTIMRALAIKDYAPATRCIVQLLQQSFKPYLQNIRGWNQAMGDRCVCIGELKLGLIAQNCIAPGFCTLLTNTLICANDKPETAKGQSSIASPSTSPSTSTSTSSSSGSSGQKANGRQHQHQHQHHPLRDDTYWLEVYRRGSLYELYQVWFSRFFKRVTFASAAATCFEQLGLMLVAVGIVHSSARSHDGSASSVIASSAASWCNGAVEILVNPIDLRIDPSTMCAFVLAASEGAANQLSNYVQRGVSALFVLPEPLHASTDEPNGITQKGNCNGNGNGEAALHSTSIEMNVMPQETKRSRFRVMSLPKLEPFQGERKEYTANSSHEYNGHHLQHAMAHRRNSVSKASPRLQHIDRTGTFHWVSRPLKGALYLSAEEAFRRRFRNHFVVCIVANRQSPPLGLCNFVAPLRLLSIPEHELRDVVFVADAGFIENEASAIAHFPRVFIVGESPLNPTTLCAINLSACSSCVVISALDAAEGYGKYVMNTSLIDKDTILCTMNIRSVPRHLSTHRPSVFRALNEGNEGDLLPTDTIGEHLNIMTEILHPRNAVFLVEKRYETDDFVMTEGYACGRLFNISVLDSMLGTAFFSPDTLLLVQSIVLGGVDENIARLCEEEDLFQSNSHESSTPNSKDHTDATEGGDGAASIIFGEARRKSRNSYRVRQYALASQPFADLLRTTDARWLVSGISATSAPSATSGGTVQLPLNCSEQNQQSTITSSSSVQSENTLSVFSTDPIVAVSRAQPSGADEHPELQLYLSNSASSETTSTAIGGGGNGVGNGGNVRARVQRANGPLSRTTFRQLFLLALRRFGMLCVGLYRKIDLGDRNDRSKRCVLTYPPEDFAIAFSDLVFVFEPVRMEELDPHTLKKISTCVDLHALIDDSSPLHTQLGERGARRLSVVGEHPFSPDGLSVVYENEAYDQSAESGMITAGAGIGDGDAGCNGGGGVPDGHQANSAKVERRGTLPAVAWSVSEEVEATANPRFLQGTDSEAEPESEPGSGQNSQSNMAFE